MCYFCNRGTSKKIYSVEILGKKHAVCSECKYIYDTLRKQRLCKRFDVLTNIYMTLKYSEKHCTICKHFNSNNRPKCKQGYWTGIGDRHEAVYPHSYANSRCPQFRRGET